MAKSGTLRVKVVGDTAPFVKSMKGLPGTVGNTVKKIAKVGVLASAALGAGAGLVGKWALGVNTELEGIRNKSQTVFGDSLGIIENWAEQSAAAMGVTQSEAVGLASSMGDLLIPMGFTRDEAAKMASETTNLAGALSQWSGGQVETAEASEILTKAMLGEREGLKQLGISIMEADVQARLLEKGQQDLTGAALQQAKAIATQELVMEKSTDAQASFEKGGQPLLQMQQQLAAITGEVAEAFATKLQPILERVSGFVTATVIPNVQGMLDAFSEAPNMVEGLKAAFGELTGAFDSMRGMDGSLFTSLLDAARNVFDRLVDWLTSGGMDQILDGLLSARQRLFDAAMQLFPAVLDAAIEFLPKLLQWVTGEMIPRLLKFIVGAVPKVLDAAVGLFQTLITAATTIIPQLLNTLLGNVLPQLLNAIVGMVPQVLDAAIDVFTALVDAVLGVLPDLLATLLGDVLPAVLTAVVDMLPKLLDAAVETFMALVEAVVQMLPQLLMTLATQVLPKVLLAISDMTPKILKAGLGAFVSLIDAVTKTLPELVDTFTSDVLPTLVDTLVEMAPDLLQAGIESFVAIAEAVDEAGPEIAQAIMELVPVLIGAFVDINAAMREAGKNMIGDLVDGILSKASAPVDAVRDIVGSARNLLPFSPAKEGPLSGRGSPAIAGAKLVEMVADGMGSQMSTLARRSRELAEAASPDLLAGRGSTSGRGGMSGGGGNTYNVTLNAPNYVGDKRELMDVVKAELAKFTARGGTLVAATARQ